MSEEKDELWSKLDEVENGGSYRHLKARAGEVGKLDD